MKNIFQRRQIKIEEYFEVSSLTGENFEKCLKRILEKILITTVGVTYENQFETPVKKKCC